jgi:hypothetical protein
MAPSASADTLAAIFRVTSKIFNKKNQTMKNTVFSITRISIILFVSFLINSCKSNSSSGKINSDSAINKVTSSGSSSSQLYSEGMKILNQRLSIASSDKEKAMELNKKAIEKFSAAYRADTSLTDPVLFASECTMYAKDYDSCVYWTTILQRLDTSRSNATFCSGRIQYCNKQLKLNKVK